MSSVLLGLTMEVNSQYRVAKGGRLEPGREERTDRAAYNVGE
jgi:hypothetical protein